MLLWTPVLFGFHTDADPEMPHGAKAVIFYACYAPLAVWGTTAGGRHGGVRRPPSAPRLTGRRPPPPLFLRKKFMAAAGITLPEEMFEQMYGGEPDARQLAEGETGGDRGERSPA
jgi:hypothetical protein